MVKSINKIKIYPIQRIFDEKLKWLASGGHVTIFDYNNDKVIAMYSDGDLSKIYYLYYNTKYNSFWGMEILYDGLYDEYNAAIGDTCWTYTQLKQIFFDALKKVRGG